MTPRISLSLSILFGVILVLAVLITIPVKGANQTSTPMLIPINQETPTTKVAREIATRSGVDIDLVTEMLTAGIPSQEINTGLAEEWPTHLAKLAEKERLRNKMYSSPLSNEERLANEALSSPSPIDTQEAEDILWSQIEFALNQDDRVTALELAQNLPQDQRQQLERDQHPPVINSPLSPDVPFIGTNGDPCNFSTYAAAMVAAAEGDTIYTMQGTYPLLIGTISKDLTFAPATNNCQTPAASGLTLDANDTNRIASISNGTQVTFTGMTLTDGSFTLGGILYVNPGAYVVLDNTHLTYGTASSKGGGLRIYYGTVEMLGESEIIYNQTTGTGDGAGVAIDHGTLIMRDSSRVGDFTDPNTSNDSGGGVYMNAGTLIMHDSSRIRSNVAATNGGGVFATNGAVIELYDYASIGYITSISNNDAVDGGGVYLDGAGTTLSISGSRGLMNNYASNYGGGAFLTNGASMFVDGARVEDNEALEKGGGVYVDGQATVEFTNASELAYNLTSDAIDAYGAAMYVYGTGAVITLTNSSVISNVSSVDYGGIRMYGSSTLHIEDSSMNYNYANSGVAGALAISGTATLDNVVMQYNQAAYNGGAIVLNNGNLTLTDPDIRFNNCRDNGGGIYRSGGNLAIQAQTKHSPVGVNRTTLQDGGGIYDSSGTNLNLKAIDGYGLFINTNTAGDQGGAIYASNGTYIYGWGWVEMTSNHAINDGGAVYLVDGATLFLDDYDHTPYHPQILVNDANNGHGGGIYAQDSRVILYGAHIGHPANGNSTHAANKNGGGIYLNHSNLTMHNTIVQNNTAAGYGGGIAAVMTSTININSYFEYPSNMPDRLQSPDASFSYCNPDTLPADRYCSEFRNNAATQNGGAIYSDFSTLSIDRTAFFSNTANHGSAFYSSYSLANVNNSLFVGNDATGVADTTSHIYKMAGSTDYSVMNAMNNTWADNLDSAVYYTHESSGAFYNNIIWGNTLGATISPLVTAACNDNQAGILAGIGNINQDPLFYTSSRGNYRLYLGSPAIDACASGNSPDMDNRARPKGTAFDMGAFESNWFKVYLPVILR